MVDEEPPWAPRQPGASAHVPYWLRDRDEELEREHLRMMRKFEREAIRARGESHE